MKMWVVVASLNLAFASLSIADEPAAPAKPAAAAEAPAPAASPTAATAAQSADKPVVADATDVEIKQIRSHGYKPQKRKDGVTMWCKSEAPLGSRFEKMTCSTAQDILAMQRNAQDATSHAQRLGTSSGLAP